MEVGDEVADFTGLDEELKRSGDASVSGREGTKSRDMNDVKGTADASFHSGGTVLRFGVFPNSPLTSVVGGAVDDGVILLFVPPWILLLTGERRADLRHLAGVPAAPARVHGAPVQPGTSARIKDFSRQNVHGKSTEREIHTNKH